MKMQVITTEGKTVEIDNIYELVITHPVVLRYKRRKGKASHDTVTEGAWTTPCNINSVIVKEEKKE